MQLLFLVLVLLLAVLLLQLSLSAAGFMIGGRVLRLGRIPFRKALSLALLYFGVSVAVSFGIAILAATLGREPDITVTLFAGAAAIVLGGIAMRGRLPDAALPRILALIVLAQLFAGLVVLLLVLPVRLFVIAPYQIMGESMAPAYPGNTLVLVDKLSYRRRAPARGDVVIFRPPFDPDVYYTKRIIALPGEKAALRDGRVYIHTAEHPEGFVIDEPYLPKDAITAGVTSEPVETGDGYFVMGDNRQHSNDSRFWGMLPRKNIVGWVRYTLPALEESTGAERVE